MRLPFRLRDLDGSVTVRCEVNQEPLRWGYGLLGLDFDAEVARGFPVVEAYVEWPAEGYGGFLGWVQAVRYRVNGGDEVAVIPDVAPQLRDSEMPYLSFGIRPVLFDAPAFTERNVVWRAWSFLTQAPDALMTPAIEPVSGFAWGYDVRDGVPSLMPPRAATRVDWLAVRDDLQNALPTWRFGGDEWSPARVDDPRRSRST